MNPAAAELGVPMQSMSTRKEALKQDIEKCAKRLDEYSRLLLENKLDLININRRLIELNLEEEEEKRH